MTNDAGGAWQPILDAQTTPDELAAIIADLVRVQLVDVLAQLDAMDLSLRERAAALVLVEPVIRAQTTRVLTAGWEDLRGEAGQVH